MKRSTERILTTHTGSLPRPDDLTELLRLKEEGEPVDTVAFDARVRAAVDEAVARQSAAGIDVLNDGEQGKPGYTVYVKDRMTGFGGETIVPDSPDADDFPEWAARRPSHGGSFVRRPACIGPLGWTDREAVERDIANLSWATQTVDSKEVFMTATSPGIVAAYHEDRFYGSEEAYVYALADLLKHEYDAIHRAGFLLQIDCPDLASSRSSRFHHLSTDEFRQVAELHIEALNHALRDIPVDAMRLHVCWGNAEGPHHNDIPLKDIIDVLLKARPAGLSVEGANPRHEHEWKVFRDVKLPDEKVLVPGVIDSTTNFIEHPELVAQRLLRYADVVGRESVVAGTDCGFGTNATENPTVDPKIAWAKLQSMAEGARLASAELW